MSVLKQVVTNLTEKRRSAKEGKKCLGLHTSPRLFAKGKGSKKTTGTTLKSRIYEAEQDENVHQPQPLEIVRVYK